MENTSHILKPEQESVLINALIANDDAAYETLVRQYSQKMYAVARRICSSDDDAQECLQKAFIQVFKNIDSFNQKSSLSTWLHRITTNEALMLLRKNKRQKTSSLADLKQQYNEYGERTIFSDSERTNLEEIFELNETIMSLKDIILKLPEKYCNVIMLRDIQEISTAETAVILNISASAVKTQLHRARLLLKAILEQQKN